MSTEPHLLELFNALNGTSYTDSKNININTLEGSFYSNLKNDISFLLDGIIIVLIEHQTTINPNMPLRFLSYLDELYRRLTSSQSAKIYGSVPIKVPAPEFCVFYDGDDISFDHKLLKLSDTELNKMISEIEYNISVNNPGLKYWHFFGHHHSNKSTFREVCLYEGVVKLVDNNYEYVC